MIMKRRSKIRILLIIILGIAGFASLFAIYRTNIKASTIRACEGDIDADFHIPKDKPLFYLDDFKPGDCVEKSVDLKNKGELPRNIFVKGVKTNPTDNEEDPYKLESILDLEIFENSTNLYDKKLLNFFEDSKNGSGVPLSLIKPRKKATYKFKVCFPKDAGNVYQQKKVVFDLIFGVAPTRSIVINEVYYKVDKDHGVDSAKDREFENIIDIKLKNTCIVLRQNSMNLQNNVGGTAGTGNNNSSGGNINSGNSGVKFNLSNFGNYNFNVGSCCCNGSAKGQNDEWIELYNPGDFDISLKNWSLVDDSKTIVTIHANKIIKAKGFALISKDASTWKYWSEDPKATVIELGSQIGDGLGNLGDHIYLRNPKGETIDAVAWQNDVVVWPVAVPNVTLGSSIERLTPGFDNDIPSDWNEKTPPTPGN